MKNHSTNKVKQPVTFNGLHPLESDAIALFSYSSDPATHVGSLLLVFRESAHMYVYDEVEVSVFAEFFNAPSKGKFHSERIQREYPARRVDALVTITLA
jgi:hypothetical protein